MANTGYASVCFLLVLATFAQCGLGQIGSTQVYNGASHDITHWKYLTHDDDTVTVMPSKTLAAGTSEVFEVPADVTCISTSYFELPAQIYGQVVLDWCKAGMPVNCLPDCYWIIDDKGFSVASSEPALLTFVAPWEIRGTGP